MPKTPRPHQKEAIRAVTKGFLSHTLGKLVMACGTGKTLIAGWIREDLQANCTLFMAPSNALIAQTLKAWREVSKVPFEALAVCCDKSVADGGAEDDLQASEVGATVTTDYQDIAGFLRSTGPRVVLCTYQSSEALTLAMSLVNVPAFDFAVADEAHRTTGGADRTFPSITNPEKIRATKKLFMTATPRFYFDNSETEIVSMDNEELYGPTFHELDFAEAIKRGLLTDYEVLIIGVSPEAEKEAVELLKKNPRLKVGDRKMAAKDLAVNIAILRTIKEKGLQRVITFHRSCARAQAASDFMPQLQDWMPKKHRTSVKLWTHTVNHTMAISDRHEILRQFEALKGPGILTNSHCLGEGVDVPTVDAIAFMDAKKSKIEIAQSVGRAIRLSPGKKKSYVIVPVIMMPGDDPEQINSRSFQRAFDVLNALRAHDSTLMERLQHWKDNGDHGVTGGTGGYEGDEGHKVTFNIPVDCNPKIADWFVCRVARTTEAQWLERVKRLGGTDVLCKEDYRWLNIQKSNVKHQRCGLARVKLLAPVFAKHGIDGVFPAAKKLAEALEYTQKHGYRPDSKSQLGLVCFTTKRHHGRHRSGWFGAAEAKLLEGIEKYPTRQYAERIEKHKRMADELDAYIAKNGCRPVSRCHLTHWFLWFRKSKDKNIQAIRPSSWIAQCSSIPGSASHKYKAKRGKEFAGRQVERIRRLKEFCKKHNRLPSRTSTDPKEGQLSLLLSKNHRYACPEASALLAKYKRRARLTTKCDLWRRQCYAAAERFCAAHGYRPTKHATNAEERKLFRFLYRSPLHDAKLQRAVTALNTKYPTKRVFLSTKRMIPNERP